MIKYNDESELQNSEHLNSESFFDDDLTKLNVRQIQTDQEKFVSTEEVPSHLEMTVDTGIEIQIIGNKMGCVFPMVILSILPHAEFGPNDHRENAPHFKIQS